MTRKIKTIYTAEISEHFTTGIAVHYSCRFRYNIPGHGGIIRLYGYLVPDGTSASGTQIDTSEAYVSALNVELPVIPGNILQFNPALPSVTGTTAPSAAVLELDPWTGRWSASNEGIGMMELTKSGSTVTGTIGDGKYVFVGTISGNELTAKWQEPDSKFNGDVVFTLYSFAAFNESIERDE